MNTNKISKFLLKLRKEKKLTQKEMADKLHITYQAVSKWENGLSIPDIETLHLISKTFNIDISEIIEGKKKNNKKFIIIIIIIAIIGFLLLYICLKKHQDFEFKTINTTCKEFNLTGSAAYSNDQASLVINNISYCNEDKTVYKNIECNLYRKNKNTETIITSVSNSNKTINEFLDNVSINVNNYACKTLNDYDLYLKINATDNNNKTITYQVDLTLDDNC